MHGYWSVTEWTYSRTGQASFSTQVSYLICRKLVRVGWAHNHVIGVILSQAGSIDQSIGVQLHLVGIQIVVRRAPAGVVTGHSSIVTGIDTAGKGIVNGQDCVLRWRAARVQWRSPLLQAMYRIGLRLMGVACEARMHSACIVPILWYAMMALTTSVQHQKGILLAERVKHACARQDRFIPARGLAWMGVATGTAPTASLLPDW